MDIKQDISNEYLWIGSYDRGLGIFDLPSQTFSFSDHPFLDLINEVFQDREENLWVMTEKNGILLSSNKQRRFNSVLFSEVKNLFIPGGIIRVNDHYLLWSSTTNQVLQLTPTDNSFSLTTMWHLGDSSHSEIISASMEGNKVTFLLSTNKKQHLYTLDLETSQMQMLEHYERSLQEIKRSDSEVEGRELIHRVGTDFWDHHTQQSNPLE